MTNYYGKMSVFFPCKIKSKELKRWNGSWTRLRKRQTDFIHHTRSPLTDLLDKKTFRDYNEAVLKAFQCVMGKDCVMKPTISPYAVECLQRAFRNSREDNAFAKYAQVVLSKFSLSYAVNSKHRNIQCVGSLIYSVNLDNGVGTLIATLRLARLSAQDIIYLKHAFYKRSLVDIVDFGIDDVADKCAGACWFDCIKQKPNRQHPMRMTIQDYVNDKFRMIGHYNQLEYDVDFRARYSFVELTLHGQLISDEELYGIMLADEGFQHVPPAVYKREIRKDFPQNISTRVSYDFYMNGLNAILVFRNLLDKVRCNLNARRFRDDMNFNHAPENIETEQLPRSCLPGLQEDFFPAYLKAVEVHYLVNKVNTNEITVHDRSFLNPWIFLKRLFSLWEILYELDTHRYHVHKTFMERFGIYRELETIRAEYNSLLTHAMSYFSVIIAIFAAILTVLQLWK